MIRRIVLTIVLLAGIAAGAAAQNVIDWMVDDFSSRGSSRFTSAVKRDPRTRNVRKVVNVLEVENADVGKFISAFKRCAKTGDFTENYTEDGCTLVLTVRKAKQNRIYMIRCSTPYGRQRDGVAYGEAKITVVVNYK